MSELPQQRKNVIIKAVNETKETNQTWYEHETNAEKYLWEEHELKVFPQSSESNYLQSIIEREHRL